MDAKDIISWIPGLALGVSFWSLWWSWKGWRESNRPLVTVHVESAGAEDGPIPYNLVVQNSGNRPAVNVRLWTDFTALSNCLDPAATGQTQMTLFEHVKRCFSPNATIPMLPPGGRAENSFGYSGTPDAGPFWKYRSTFYVNVAYLDVEGHEYRHRLMAEIQDTVSFAGGQWSQRNAS